jgi:hypothetical protein
MAIYTQEFRHIGTFYEPLRFQVLHVQAHAKVSEQGATVVIKKKIKTSGNQDFRNQGIVDLPTKNIPISYNFPIPTSGAVVRFKVTFEDQRVIESKCFPADEAKEKYEQALKDTSQPRVALVTNHTSDLFSVFIGNFDPDTTFEIETEYVCSLEYDTEYSGLRFSIPTTVFPRYGESPEPEVAGHIQISSNCPRQGIFVSAEYVGDDNFQSFSCVSHEDVRVTDRKATYANENQFLEKDFVTVLKLKEEAIVNAVYEPIPNIGLDFPIPAIKNILQVNFNSFNSSELVAPSSAKKEIIFIIDRSGSMYENIATLKATMRLFISSFPNDETTIFNIISFGSSYKMLWEKSKTLDAKSFDEVQALINSIDADMGGTEVLDPIQAAVKSRRVDDDAETEIVLLTDGEVYNVPKIRDFIQSTQQKKSNNIRFFSFGIGDYVSHALLDAIADAGKGCKQTVMNQERMEKKVIKLLKICLSAPITSVDIHWKKDLSQPLSFTTQEVPVSTIRRDSRFIVTPELGLLPLIPTINSTMYIFFGSELDLLENLSIKLSFKDGRSYSYTAPIVKKVGATSENGITYLSISGAKKLIRDIENSNLVSNYDKAKFGTALGLLFNMTTTWTSLLAVEQKGADKNEKPLYFEQSETRPLFGSGIQLCSAKPMFGSCKNPCMAAPPPLCPSSAPLFGNSRIRTRSVQQSLATSSPAPAGFAAGFSGAPLFGSSAVNSQQTARFGSSLSQEGTDSATIHETNGSSFNFPMTPSINVQNSLFKSYKSSTVHNDAEPELTTLTSYDKLERIVKFSNFDGSFKADKNLISILIASSQLTEKHKALLDKLTATGDLGLLEILVLLYLKLELGDIKDSWSILSEKVKRYIEKNVEKSIYQGLI